MTEVEVLAQMAKFIDSLVTFDANIMMAQKVKGGIRINTGKSILTYDSELLRFKSKYTMISVPQLARARKVIEVVSRLTSLRLVSVIPKEWGYRFKVYDGVKCAKTYDLKLYVTRSPIICWTYMILRFFHPKQMPK